MTDAAIPEARTPAVATVDVTAKAGLVLLLALALLFPDVSHLRDKAAELRAVGNPAASFAIPLLWWTLWKDRMSFPWLPDFLVTITCFTDILAPAWTSTTRSRGSTTGCTS